MKRWRKINKLYLPIFLIFNLVSCQNSGLDKTFFDGEYNIYPSQFFSIEDNDYYIYFYSLFCPPCEDLKDDMIDFIKNNRVYCLSREDFSEEDYDLFKTDDSDKSLDELINEMKGTSDINEIYLLGTPSLYVVKNKRFDNLLYGYQSIKQFID